MVQNIQNLSERQCCICHTNAKFTLFRIIADYQLMRCLGCGLVFLAGQAVDNTTFYSDVTLGKGTGLEYWGVPEYQKKYESIIDGYFAERWKRLRLDTYSHRSSFDVLDVGCGFGFWMNFCIKKGLPRQSISGIDIDRTALQFAKEQLELNVELEDVEAEGALGSGKKFDRITLCDVLEHVRSPHQVLGVLAAHLKDDGLMYIQVPHEVPWWTYPRRKSWGLPHHLWHFSATTLSRLLEENGFEVQRVWTGIQGVIGRWETTGGVSWYERMMWWLASKMRFGNRLQVLVKKVVLS